jgi:hypothetical protein
MAASTAVRTAAPALADRAQGRQPSRMRSLFAASVVGATAAVVTYRLLRRPPARDSENDAL